MTEQHCNFK